MRRNRTRQEAMNTSEGRIRIKVDNDGQRKGNVGIGRADERASIEEEDKAWVLRC